MLHIDLKRRLASVLALSACALLASAALFAGGCKDNSDQGDSNGSGASSGLITGDDVGSDTGDGTDGDGAEEAGQDLVIPLSSITSSANFFGTTVEGTYMEVIAFKYGSSYRTAFNTCQVCYGSRKAYYLQSGSYLVCQSCSGRYALANVGINISANTCSPFPILANDRTLTDDSIIISYDYLVQCKNYFKTWKVVT